MPKYLLSVCWDSEEEGTEPMGTWAPINSPSPAGSGSPTPEQLTP